MNIENIISVFCRLSGADEEFSVKYRFLCENAMENISCHLKTGADIGSNSSKLEFAAAALAYYRFILWSAAEYGQDITVGDLSVKASSDKLPYAAKLRDQAFEDISDIFDSGYFIFEGI